MVDVEVKVLGILVVTQVGENTCGAMFIAYPSSHMAHGIQEICK